jgi:hypothetical protein
MMGSCYTLIAEIIKDPTLCNNVKWEIREDICIQGAQK